MTVWLRVLALLTFVLAPPAHAETASSSAGKPNVVLIIVDDMGMGDFAPFGNPIVAMPHLNALHAESLRLTDFHVDPTCSPTRAALMTGQHSLRAGVWHTIMARHQLKAEAYTMAELFRDNGYATGIFGKWHLGDNYPMRPQDQGFDEVVIHGGGGVGQTPDYWGNTHFGDTYFANGEPKGFVGHATDVWFAEAGRFIAESAAEDRPFFAYIALNAAHTPWRAPLEFVQPYLEQGLPSEPAKYYGMVTHLDARMGALRAQLEEQDLAENTVFIFTSDNGTALNPGAIRRSTRGLSLEDILARQPGWAAWNHNAGLSGYKAAVTDGGHRVPLFFHWPAGGFAEGRDVETLAAHFDMLPTLVDLLKLEASMAPVWDGVSLRPALAGDAMPDRTLVVTNQRVPMAHRGRPAQVMTESWRYQPDGQILHAIEQDPGQTTNVADTYPQVAAQMQAAYDAWWAEMEPTIGPVERPVIGGAENPMRLTAHDYVYPAEREGSTKVPWYPGFGDDSFYNEKSAWLGKEDSYEADPLAVSARTSGRYAITLYFHDAPAARSVPLPKAHLVINGDHQMREVVAGLGFARFETDLPAGDIDLTGWFSDSEDAAPNSGKSVPAFFVYVEKLAP